MKTGSTIGVRGKAWERWHQEAFNTSSLLTVVHRQMYDPMAAKVTPKKVIKILSEAGVIGLLLGTHGVGGYRSQPRATQDVDLLIRKKEHTKAIKAVRKAFPQLDVRDASVVTRFLDPRTGNPVVDLMKPMSDLFKVAFRFSLPVGQSYRIPQLELALVSKFAAMVSPNREQAKKLIDAGDFVDMVKKNLQDIDEEKLKLLANKVYLRGAVEIIKIIRNVEMGRPITI
jgi:hypothetical protein